MEWLERVVRGPCGLEVVSVSSDGSRRTISKDRLADAFADGKPLSRARLATNWADWRREEPGTYLAALGFTPPIAPSHAVYSFDAEGVRYHVPAALAMVRLLRPYHLLSGYLLVPGGLDQACVIAQTRDSRPRVAFRRPFIDNLAPAAGRATFSWLMSFPSAKRFWSSLYRHAAAGELAFEAPQAHVSLSVRGMRLGSDFFVRDIRYLAIETTEEPFAFAEGHDVRLRLHETAARVRTTNRGAAPARDARIRPHAGGWALTDEEWGAIEPMFLKWAHKHPRRDLVDAIIEKLGTGTPWVAPGKPAALMNSASVVYSRLRRNGAWERVVQVLKSRALTEPG